MAGTTTPWWRDVLTRTARGIRAGVAALFRPAKQKPAVVPAVIPQQEKIREEETALTEKPNENFPHPQWSDAGANASQDASRDSDQDAGRDASRGASPQANAAAPETLAADPLPREAENPPESPADLLAEVAFSVESVSETAPEAAEPDLASAPEPELPVGVETASEEGAEAEEVPEQGPEEVPESLADLLAEAATELDLGPEDEPVPADEMPVESAEEPAAVFVEEQTVESSPEPEPIEAAPESTPTLPEAAADASDQPVMQTPAVAPQPQSAPLPPKAASAPPQVVVHEAIKREQGPDTSPVSVIVSQVYDGPFDLLLDLIRKQDIDIYDIPIAKITAQFLTYVNQLKSSDMDVAGEFIYTASLLIHIKSKMLLPREPKNGDDGQEDPRRELVERLLEHERFKNAAQMLQQKQMLEAATWTNPGVREFRESAGETEIGPEIAADTTDLVRVFREILERARSRPVIDVQEDSVTVGQMIQFLGRRLSMEDKPVPLRRLLANTQSERALIAMFLALLELVRLQAILLRQDRHFSEIFIKKNSGFEAVVNQGLARDDWQ